MVNQQDMVWKELGAKSKIFYEITGKGDYDFWNTAIVFLFMLYSTSAEGL